VTNLHAGVICRLSLRLQPGVQVGRQVEVEQGFAELLKAADRLAPTPRPL
jgi:hypothetical protein